MNLTVNEIFVSIDGEVNGFEGQGAWSTFVRFQGCNLRCSYCDTSYAQKIQPDYGKMSVEDIMTKIKAIGCNKVTITGGEPLLQKDGLRELLKNLSDQKYITTIETNGSLPLEWVGNVWDSDCRLIVDYKLPSSGQESKMVDWWRCLTPCDYVKFVMQDIKDYNRAKDLLMIHKPFCNIAFSPSPRLDPVMLMEWMKEDKLFKIKLNMQIHKLIGAR